MTSSTHIVKLMYAMLVEGNLSRILPLVDEQVSIYIPQHTLFDEAYHGRNGFLALLSSVYEFTDCLALDRLTCFTPANDSLDDAIVTFGTCRGTLPRRKERFSLPFLHYWLLQNEKVTVFRAFHWDTDGIIPNLLNLKEGPDLLANH